MKTPASAAMIARTTGNSRPGASPGARAPTAKIVPTPSSRAAVARNARLKSSSVRREGFCAMAGGIGRKKERRGSPAALSCLSPEGSDALRLAFLVGRGQRGRTHVDRAGLGRRGVAHVRRPTVRRQGDGRADDATGGR